MTPVQRDSSPEAKAYLDHLTGEPTHLDDLGRKHYPECPACGTTRFHAPDCDAGERFGAEARALYFTSE